MASTINYDINECVQKYGCRIQIAFFHDGNLSLLYDLLEWKKEGWIQNNYNSNVHAIYVMI